ncbi:acetate kinase [Ventosimonas gracilis]|uniref:Acetate kinase n=1 Tax=Ventosimonas gracilis TaxID=1680762 RepID=A0A139SQB1_9GAMM|nr:acetate/propionate family kinase [Ventosimonas gracilis]KXU36795.1 acetate kinase [Ventosimonas gracilis]
MPSEQALILVLNCGSSSIKFAVFAANEPQSPRALHSGKVQGIGSAKPLLDESGAASALLVLDSEHPYRSALTLILERVAARLNGARLVCVAHRVVHGGNRYFAPTVLNSKVLADLHELVPLAPLHQPFALDAVQILLREQADLLQVACFDTAFHHHLPKVEQMLALPHEWFERGVRRYGFHGLSYEYMASVLPGRHGERASGRVIVAHLGSGASLCALQNLQSVATTMGFSALDGLMMGTRPGALDAGVVLYLLENEKLSVKQVERLLYQQSGLLGVSGISPEVRVLLEQEAENEHAGEALLLYIRRIVREIGAMVAVLGGLDMLVFTAGVGENSAEIRRRICAQLGFLPIALDETANQQNAPLISAPDSGVKVAVERTNEEWIAARHALQFYR